MKRKIKQKKTALGTLEDFKAFLGELSEDYTEAELYELQRDMRAMAEILLEHYVEKIRPELPPIEF